MKLATSRVFPHIMAVLPTSELGPWNVVCTYVEEDVVNLGEGRGRGACGIWVGYSRAMCLVDCIKTLISD